MGLGLFLGGCFLGCLLVVFVCGFDGLVFGCVLVGFVWLFLFHGVYYTSLL